MGFSACLQVLANLVMEELLPSLQTELLPKLKGKKAERKRVWFAVSEISLLLTAILRDFDTLCGECHSQATFWLVHSGYINPLFFWPPHHPKQFYTMKHNSEVTAKDFLPLVNL